MDTETGEMDIWEKMKDRDPMDLESFEHGETVQIKAGFFQITKIDLQKQRLVLKPIPRPELKEEESPFQEALKKMGTKVYEP
jgi:hypothetical protein